MRKTNILYRSYRPFVLSEWKYIKTRIYNYNKEKINQHTHIHTLFFYCNNKQTKKKHKNSNTKKVLCYAIMTEVQKLRRVCRAYCIIISQIVMDKKYIHCQHETQNIIYYRNIDINIYTYI